MTQKKQEINTNDRRLQIEQIKQRRVRLGNARCDKSFISFRNFGLTANAIHARLWVSASNSIELK